MMRATKQKSMKAPLRRIPEVDAFAISILAQAEPSERPALLSELAGLLGPQGRQLANRFIRRTSPPASRMPRAHRAAHPVAVVH